MRNPPREKGISPLRLPLPKRLRAGELRNDGSIFRAEKDLT